MPRNRPKPETPKPVPEKFSRVQKSDGVFGRTCSGDRHRSICTDGSCKAGNCVYMTKKFDNDPLKGL